MLSKKEKKEMLADSKNQKRRKEFAGIKTKRLPISLDDFLKYLKGFQNIFYPFQVSRVRMITRNNKL